MPNVVPNHGSDNPTPTTSPLYRGRDQLINLFDAARRSAQANDYGTLVQVMAQINTLMNRIAAL